MLLLNHHLSSYLLLD